MFSNCLKLYADKIEHVLRGNAMRANKGKVSAGFHSRHFYSAAIAVTAVSALEVDLRKIAASRIRTVVGFVASLLGTLTASPPRCQN